MIDKWISVTKRLPENQKKVFSVYLNSKGIRRRTIAQYIPPKTVLSDDYLAHDLIDCSGLEEYDEKLDCSWVMGGWFEYAEEAELNYTLANTVTHWMELPDLPSFGRRE